MRIVLPHLRRLNASFALTPLVDVIFLLLIFFMLTSRIAPFATISFSNAAQGALPGAAVGAPQDGEALRDADVLLSVGAGRIRLNGRAVEAAGLREALEEERRRGALTLALLPLRTASVQDFVTALETAKSLSFASIVVADMR